MVDTLNDQLRKGGSIPTPTLQDCSVIAYPLFYTENNISPTSPLQFELGIVPTPKAKELNKKWHSRLPDFPAFDANLCHTLIYDGRYYAVAIWSHPISRHLPKTYLELRRMAICSNAPKNTASRFIKLMILDIRKRMPDITTVVSYQDTLVHLGTIYKASGWKQAAESKGPNWKTKWPYHQRNEYQADSPKIRWEKDI